MMLTNYDAKAVAEVLGLAFLRNLDDDASSNLRLGGRKVRASADVVPGADFVIYVDGSPVAVVELKAVDVPSPTPASDVPRSDRRAPAGRRVSAPSSDLIEKAVEKGLPRAALRRVAESLAGGDKAKVAALEWGVVPKTTLERRETRLSLHESERTERVARLFVHARRALGTEAEAREFMTTPHPELDGRSPIDAAKTDLGTRRTEQLLNALEYGLAL